MSLARLLILNKIQPKIQADWFYLGEIFSIYWKFFILARQKLILAGSELEATKLEVSQKQLRSQI